MNLTFLGLCLACMGVSIAEGMLMSNLFKSASRQPEIIGQLRTLMIMGIAFIEGTFFVTLVMAFIIK
ncbi:ATP synthase F0 sector subunit C [Streptococcus sanguinis SK1 = NCTC 7863]|jgi:ATP synthase subunit c|uniref:F0F1 ATP synthase subunit C n=1 Tax=Streptococcus TaxID=1301 RepID=UPI000204C249|nr:MULTISPECIES: F0F1 ATP synthase subunit C [Streptococcus]ARC47104.1 F0F1 ATP synthase subunit C [Streptococcus gordonii]EGF07894.1 ATP synthase F0 sector subunit C [Streptococcus sanguinis SK1 = NCTC 7863]EGF21210.1 ATP synthase F0 sector subunit C [Streptococcus sanguinis SK1058]MBN2958478.1 F0F1 ATP synthase subunit C [Streptococcus gordonii]MBZ2066230.1 F0F1 ATP synthase subunit C [Streptococcus sanguinis]